jgi:RHS repeat-associated protein
VADWTIAYDTAPLDVDGDGDPDTVALGLPASMNASTGSGPLAGTWTTATTGYTPRYQATGTTRVLPEGPDLAGLPRTWTVGHRWRGNGDPDRTVLPPVVDPVTGEVLLPGEEVVTGYDAYGRPATVTGAGAYVAGTVYTPAGRPAVTGSEPVPGAGTWTTTGYDGAGRPARTAWYTTGPDGTIAQDQLATTSHDPAGNPTRTTTRHSSTLDTSTPESTGVVDRVCAAFDALARLVATWTPPTSCTGSTPGALDPGNPHALAQSWVFDPATGLPTTLTSSTGAGTTTTALAHVPGTHQPAAATSTGPGAAARTLTWQPDGTPATWTGPDGTPWTATSDTSGATTTLTSSGPGGSTTIDRAVGPDGQLLAERTAGPAGTTLQLDLGPIGRITITSPRTGQETVTAQRDQHRPDGTLAATRTGPALTGTWAFRTDTAGTPIAAAGTTMLDGTGPVARRWWTAYGGPRGPPTGTWPADPGWLGRPQHAAAQEATGLTRLGARDHDPTLGTFTSPDPLAASGDPGSLDPYAYARWNPLTSSDPTGLWPNWRNLGRGLRDVAYQLVVADFAGCVRGSGSACAWAAVGFVPGAGKAAKGIALAAKNLLRRGSGLTEGIAGTRAGARATESTAGATRHTPPHHHDPPTRTPATSAANPPTTATAANGGSAVVKVGDFGSPSSAFSHYSKHVKGVILGKNGSATVKPGGADMPEFTSFSQYRAAARDFMGGAAGPGVIERGRGTDVLRVDPSTGYFGVRSQDGTIRTFFRPDGDPVAYFWGLQ